MTELPKTYDPGDIAAAADTTSIDRRTCTRVVPMRVLCLGVSRTGTTCHDETYHFASLIQNEPDAVMWIEALEAKFKSKGKPFSRAEWDQLLGHCQAITDTPCIILYKELLEAYPNAKVILSVRDSADQWFDSMMNTLIPWSEAFTVEPAALWQRLRLKWFSPVSKNFGYLCHLCFRYGPYYQALISDRRNGTQTAKKWYEEYIDEVKSIVPKEKLLVFNVKEGWAPLCAFLGHEIPDLPFPRRNDTATFMQNAAGYGGFVESAIVKGIRRTMLLGSAVVAGALALGAGWYFS
ncbi:hypothetical protein LTR86_004326 [Recurvomyces mirabilis]|nr:hypothetical protein LTR86_004326 [Recurvomyces mirabilis]